MNCKCSQSYLDGSLQHLSLDAVWLPDVKRVHIYDIPIIDRESWGYCIICMPAYRVAINAPDAVLVLGMLGLGCMVLFQVQDDTFLCKCSVDFEKTVHIIDIRLINISGCS